MQVRFTNLKHRGSMSGLSLSAKQRSFISSFPEGSDPSATFRGSDGRDGCLAHCAR